MELSAKNLAVALGAPLCPPEGCPLEGCAPLTAAERDVCERLSRGQSNARIAFERGTSVSTVANQVAAIFQKAGVCSRSELAVRCLTRGNDLDSEHAVIPTLARRPLCHAALWQALVSGECRLARRYQSDGSHDYVVHRAEPAEGRGSALTQREQHVVSLAARGCANKLIGHELGLTASTVSCYLLGAQRKLGVASRHELLRLVWLLLAGMEPGSPGGPEAPSTPQSEEREPRA
jgi:DNA-binding NarL/FixJ family response regulator